MARLFYIGARCARKVVYSVYLHMSDVSPYLWVYVRRNSTSA